MSLQKFENYDNSDITWNVKSIEDLIKYYEKRIIELEGERESSSFPEGEEQEINGCEECVSLLRGMIDKKSWFYKFNKKA